MQRYYKLDWLSITLPYSDVPEEIIPLIPGLERRDDIHPVGYFNSAYDTPCGAIVRWHTEVPSQGLNVQLTGSALAWLYDHANVGDGEIIQGFYGLHGKVARLDYACDLMGYAGNGIRELISDFRAGKCNTRVRQIHEFKGESVAHDTIGHTLYIGSKKGDKFVRVYDKAKEMKLLGEAWLRVEMQTRGRIADTMFTDMAERERGYGVSEVGRRWVKAHCDFPECEWWIHLFAQDVIGGDISQVPRKKTAFEAYLEQVKKAIANHMESDRELIEGFLGDVAALFSL